MAWYHNLLKIHILKNESDYCQPDVNPNPYLGTCSFISRKLHQLERVMSSWRKKQMLSKRNSKKSWKIFWKAKRKWGNNVNRPISLLQKPNMLQANSSTSFDHLEEKLLKQSKDRPFALIKLKKILLVSWSLA